MDEKSWGIKGKQHLNLHSFFAGRAYDFSFLYAYYVCKLYAFSDFKSHGNRPVFSKKEIRFTDRQCVSHDYDKLLFQHRRNPGFIHLWSVSIPGYSGKTEKKSNCKELFSVRYFVLHSYFNSGYDKWIFVDTYSYGTSEGWAQSYSIGFPGRAFYAGFGLHADSVFALWYWPYDTCTDCSYYGIYL